MIGWLIVNHFIHSPKFEEIFDWLEKAAADRDIELKRFTNAQVLCALGDIELQAGGLSRPDFVLFWDKDIHLAMYLERLGMRLFNSASSIAWCDDKAMTQIRLHGHGIAMPVTIVAPKTFPRSGYPDYGFLQDVTRRLGYPLVVKECFGSFGQQVFLARREDQLLDIVSRIGIKPMLFQEFISTSSGRDVRIHVVGGKYVAAMYRQSTDGDFRANATMGAKVSAYTPDAAQLEMALAATAELGLDFSGVDILFGWDGKPILCEVNSNAHFRNLFNCTGVNVADAIMEHIAQVIGETSDA